MGLIELVLLVLVVVLIVQLFTSLVPVDHRIVGIVLAILLLFVLLRGHLGLRL